MDLNNALEVAEEYAQGYTVYILSLFHRPTHPLPVGPTKAVTKKLFSFSIISATIGAFILNSVLADGRGAGDTAGNVTLIGVTLLNWGLVSVIIHAILRIFNPELAFLDTFAAVVAVLPIAFAFSAYASYVAFSVVHFFLLKKSATPGAILAFVILQPVFVGVCLPASLRTTTGATRWATALSTILAVVLVLFGSAMGAAKMITTAQFG